MHFLNSRIALRATEHLIHKSKAHTIQARLFAYTTTTRIPAFNAIVKSATIQHLQNKNFATATTGSATNLDATFDHSTYERVCSETLDALCDYFEEMIENAVHLKGTDVSYGDGVLTINLGKKYGTYVINRQTPNKQIWLSSPTSGPKRYDFIKTNSNHDGKWIYKHTGEKMHDLLQKEMTEILQNSELDFSKLPYGS